MNTVVCGFRHNFPAMRNEAYMNSEGKKRKRGARTLTHRNNKACFLILAVRAYIGIKYDVGLIGTKRTSTTLRFNMKVRM